MIIITVTAAIMLILSYFGLTPTKSMPTKSTPIPPLTGVVLAEAVRQGIAPFGEKAAAGPDDYWVVTADYENATKDMPINRPNAVSRIGKIGGQMVTQYLQDGDYAYYVTKSDPGFSVDAETKTIVRNAPFYNIYQRKTADERSANRLLAVTTGRVIGLAPASDYLKFTVLADGQQTSGRVVTDNPFIMTSESSTPWEYDIFEVFRGAEREIYRERLTYEQDYWAADGTGTFYFKSVIPQIPDTDAYSRAFNRYFRDKQENDKLSAGAVCVEEEIDPITEGLEISYEIEYGYNWDNFTTAIEKQYYITGRVWCDPQAVNFWTPSGQVLGLDDLFRVGPEEYRPVLEQILPGCVSKFGEHDALYQDPSDPYVPLYADDDRLPLPRANQFMITPSGIVFIYAAGEIEAALAGAQFLMIGYDELEDWLNPAYFADFIK